MGLCNINEKIGEKIGALNVMMKHTQSRPYPKAEHLGNPFVVGSLTDHQTSSNLTCSGRPFRSVRATLLFGSQRAVSVCLRYPIPVGHCQ